MLKWHDTNTPVVVYDNVTGDYTNYKAENLHQCFVENQTTWNIILLIHMQNLWFSIYWNGEPHSRLYKLCMKSNWNEWMKQNEWIITSE